MISQMVLGFVAIVLAVVFSMFTGPLIAGILLFLVFAILSLLFGLLLLVSGVKKYDSIEV